MKNILVAENFRSEHLRKSRPKSRGTTRISPAGACGRLGVRAVGVSVELVCEILEMCEKHKAEHCNEKSDTIWVILGHRHVGVDWRCPRTASCDQELENWIFAF